MPTLASPEGQEDAAMALAAQQGDDHAMNTLARKYYHRLCDRITHRYSTDIVALGLTEQDVRSEATHLGFLYAIENYDPAKGSSFNNFASLCIRHKINNFLNGRKNSPKNALTFVPHEFSAEQYNEGLTDDSFDVEEQDFREEDTELVDQFNTNSHMIDDSPEYFSASDLSSDDEAISLSSTLPDEKPDPLEKMLMEEARAWLSQFMKPAFEGKKTERAQEVFASHHAFDTDFDSLAEKYNVTGSALHLQYRRVVKRLKKRAEEQGVKQEDVMISRNDLHEVMLRFLS